MINRSYPTIDIITGPTASGKSSISFELASRDKDIEIVSADAFQVYRGLDIGTAKPTVDEQNLIPHHLIDIIEPIEIYTAGRFFIEAEKTIDEILNRGKKPLIVGGTGLYIKTLTDGLFSTPEIDPNIRLKLQLEAENIDNDLYLQLKQVDPEYADKISSNDYVRVIRALEIYYALGIPFTKAHKIYHREPKYSYNINIVDIDRDLLYDSINKRVETMWRSGWIDEVRALLDKGYDIDTQAFRAIGYRYIINYIIDNSNNINANNDSYDSNITELDTINLISRDTRRFAKRQLTWFKGIKNSNHYATKADLLNKFSL